MNYNFKHQITHEDKIISDKVNYFADVFYFTHQSYGKPGFPDLENHLSLLKKILFQLENYSKHSPPYIFHYCKNKYLKRNDRLVNDFYKAEFTEISKLRVRFEKDNTEELRDELRIKLKDAIEILTTSLFKNSLNSIISAIECKHTLSGHEHVDIIDYYTPLLVSEFVYQGFSAADLNEIFNKILTREVNLHINKVQTDIPLPQELYKNDDDPQKFYDEVISYLKNRTLKQQFEGIYNILLNAQNPKTYLFRLLYVEVLRSTDLVYDDVKFCNQVKQKYVRDNSPVEFRSFFEGESTLFAEVSGSHSKESAIRKVHEAVNFLNATLGLHARAEEENYVVQDGNGTFCYSPYTPNIHQGDDVLFQRENPYQLLDRAGPLSLKFLQIDPIYFLAKSERKLDLKIVHYWRYLESFFESNDDGQIRKIVAEIISRKRSAEKHFFAIKNFALRIFEPIRLRHNTKSSDSFSTEDYRQIYTLILKRWPFSFEDANSLAKLLSHPFLMKISNIDKFEQQAQTFYEKILLETYEQRNFNEHCGISNPVATTKILFALPNIVEEFRALVIDELQKNKQKTFKEIIEALRS